MHRLAAGGMPPAAATVRAAGSTRSGLTGTLVIATRPPAWDARP